MYSELNFSYLIAIFYKKVVNFYFQLKITNKLLWKIDELTIVCCKNI